MDRRIVLGVLIFLIVIILIKSAKNNMNDPSIDPVIGDQIAIYNYIKLVPPATMPVYNTININQKDLVIADYTGVPLNLSKNLKCKEDPNFYIVDRKYTILTYGVVLDADKPENLIRITPELTYAMAGLGENCDGGRNGKTKKVVWDLWKTLNDIIVGRIFETTREVSDKLIQQYIDADMTDQEIDNSFINDMVYIKSLPVNEKVDKSCRDSDKRCPAWAKKNDCTLNPKHMLKYCAKSCNSCNYKETEIDKLDTKFATRTSNECSFHGGYSVE